MSMEPVVIVCLRDTLWAAGVRSLLKDYFGISAVMCSGMAEVERADSQCAMIVTSSDIFSSEAEFFFPRRSRVVVISSSPDAAVSAVADEGTIVEALRAGIDRLRSISETSAIPVQPVLSPREESVLILIARGFINKEIADKLEISLNTVLTHRKNIMAKLGIRSVSGLSLYALMNGYVTQNDVAR